jgi:IS5 family transposase
VIEKLHRRVVEIAQENKIATGRRMRVDTTVVETDVHYRMSSEGWRIQRESTPPG